MLPAKINFLAFESFLGFDENITSFGIDVGTNSLKSFQMKIDGTVTNHTSTRNRNARSPESRYKGPHDTNRSPHFSNDLVGRLRVNVCCCNFDSATVAFDLTAEGTENLKHIIGVGDIGYAFNDNLLIGQKGCCKNGKGRVFRSGNINGSGERGAAVHEKFVHSPFLLGELK